MKIQLLKIIFFFMTLTNLTYAQQGQNLNAQLPESLKPIVTQEEYTIIVNKCKIYFKNKGWKIKEFESGVLYVNDGIHEVDNSYRLDDLVKLCISDRNTIEITELVDSYFKKLEMTDEDTNLGNSFIENFELAKPYILHITNGDQKISRKWLEEMDYPYREYLKGTFTVLALEFPTKYMFITKDILKKWNKSEDELFQIAQENVNEKEVEIIKYSKDSLNYFMLSSGNYSVSQVIDFYKNFPECVGSMGTIIGIPSKRTAFAIPVYEFPSKQDLSELFNLVNDSYQNDPGQVSLNIYWYLNSKFYMFNIEKENDEIKVIFPKIIDE